MRTLKYRNFIIFIYLFIVLTQSIKAVDIPIWFFFVFPATFRDSDGAKREFNFFFPFSVVSMCGFWEWTVEIG